MSKFIKNNKSTHWHYTEPFNLDSIFHRIRILLHKSEPNRNPEKQNRNRTEQIVPGSRFFRVPLTDKHYSELIGFISFHAVGNQFIELEKVLIKQHPNLPSVCCYWWSGVFYIMTISSNRVCNKQCKWWFLIPNTFESIFLLEVNLRLKVGLFFKCDGASANRSFFQML